MTNPQVKFAEDLLPKAKIVGTRFVFGECEIDLVKKPLTLKVFQSFLDSPQWSRSKDELVEQIYGRLSRRTNQVRFSAALRHNVIKLVSRARALADREFNKGSIRYEWFTYDPRKERWQLYHIATESLRRRIYLVH